MMDTITHQAVSEETLFFDLPHTDSLKIKGILRGNLAGPVVVMLHGRPGTGNELLQYLGARYLHVRGLSTLRLYMYDFAPHTRNLMDCTLETHVQDFEAVIRSLRRRGAGPIFAVGHSYGGLTILASKVRLDGAVLWDPSHGLWWAEGRDSLYEKEFPEKIVDDYVIGTAGAGWVYPAAALAYDKRLGDTSGLAAKAYPLKVIAAGNGALVDLCQKYYAAANQPKSYVAVPGAGHGFDESDEITSQLFAETAGWLSDFRANDVL